MVPSPIETEQPEPGGVSCTKRSPLPDRHVLVDRQADLIAQTLFVTRKTVEAHLGHAYRKLAISGRGELARAMAGRTPAGG